MIRILLARMVIYRLGRLISPNSSPPQALMLLIRLSGAILGLPVSPTRLTGLADRLNTLRGRSVDSR